MPNFALCLPEVLAFFIFFFLGGLLETKPVLEEIRCVCFQAWCVGVVLLAFWLCFPAEV